MTLTSRRLSAVAAFGLMTLVSLTTAADTASQSGAIFPGWKSIASTNWSVNTAAIQNWRTMLARWADGKACESETCTTKDWAAMVEQVKAAGDLLPKAKLANSLINKHAYVEDIKNWNLTDYWETPYQFLKRSGDTEDFAIAKYFLLRAAGVPAADMQIIAARLKSLGGIGHAILAVHVDDTRTVILDNRTAAVLDAKLLKDEFRPALGVNEDTWWVYLPPQ
jgi:predicted transglutaminase-like cysteine proteinase